MDKLWDEELKSKIFCALGPDEGDGPDENEVWECIQQDRKHQREELLKRLPSVEEIRARLFIPFGNYKAWRKDEISKAIHDLIEEKLEGKKHAEKCPLYNEEGLSNEEEENE